MEKGNKLYKCYKPGCNFKADDPDNPYLTQIEYDELIKDGKIMCPEYHEECGIRELKPEDYPKPPKPIINKRVFALIGALVLLVLVALYFIIKPGSKNNLSEEPKVHENIQGPAVGSPEKNEDHSGDELAELPSAPPPSAASPSPNKTPPLPASSSQSRTFPNGARYVGEIKGGRMHGLGTYYYKNEQLISQKDIKKRMAQAGDYLIGEWYEGEVVNGKLYDNSNNIKEVIIIGR